MKIDYKKEIKIALIKDGIILTLAIALMLIIQIIQSH